MTEAKNTFEFEGEKALETAKTVLSNYNIEGSVERISVEIEEAYEERDEGNGQSADDSDDRELKQIRSNTNHHKVLTAVKEMQGAGKTPVSGKQLHKYIGDDEIKEGSVYASLNDLYNRRLVERERVKRDGTHQNVYEMTGYGDEELKRLGTYDFD